MKREEAMKLVENGIAALNDALRAGHSETLERFLESLARFHNYSFNNALLIALQRPDATRVAGFHAWASLAASSRKGSTESPSLPPCRAAKIVTNGNRRRPKARKRCSAFDRLRLRCRTDRRRSTP